jgi:ABC-type antimicrobial peptide transport system permease subunit
VIAETDPSYLKTIGVPIIRGRSFTDADGIAGGSHGPFVAVVNETFVTRYLGDRNPIGQTVLTALPGGASLGTLTLTIVGVARDYRQERPPNGIPPTMYVYVPLGSTNTPIVVRASGDTASLVSAVRAIVREMDPGVRVARVEAFEDSVTQGLALQRLYQRVLGVFALLALGMAIVGVYGVATYVAAQRMREFGIRVALGAAPRQLFQLMLAQGLRATALGLTAGLIAAWWLTRLLERVLYGVRPHDAVTFIAVAAGLAVVALAAGFVPARRAARVDPLITLKAE